MKRLAPLLFILAGCCLLTLAVAVIGAVFLFRNVDTSDALAWKPPLELVDNRALAPDTVLLPLTGIAPSDALNAALDKAQIENAYALLAYDPTLSDATRIGALLQLGARYANAKDTAKAAACFQAAAGLATLSPALSDQARMDAYQQASDGLRKIGSTSIARRVTDQAYLVAQYSPTLKHDVRARRLEQIAQNYADLGAGALAAQARAKSIDAAGVTTEDKNPPAHLPFVPAAGKLPASPQLDAAVKTRLAAAQQLNDDVQNLAKPTDSWDPDLLSQLSDALLAEDAARQTYYNQIPQTKDPAIQIALLRDRVNWLALKYRIARGAFGKTIVADWSHDPGSLADAWGDAWAEWFNAAEAQARAVAKPQNPDQAMEDVVRQELIAARWGWDNRASESDLVDSLSAVTQRLMQASTPALRLDTFTRGKASLYLLVPDDLYGQGEKALPK